MNLHQQMSRAEAAPLLEAALRFLKKLGTERRGRLSFMVYYLLFYLNLFKLCLNRAQRRSGRGSAALVARTSLLMPCPGRSRWRLTSKTCTPSHGSGASPRASCALWWSSSPSTNFVRSLALDTNSVRYSCQHSLMTGVALPDDALVKRLLEALIPQEKVDEECFVLVLGAQSFVV